MEKEKTQKKGTEVLKAILNTIINILIVMVLVVSLLIAVMSLTSKANNGVSVVFGHTVENIITDSMKGGSKDFDGGDFEKGDVILGKFTDYDFDAEYKVGDIVTYRGDLDGNRDTIENICHRIIEVNEYKGSKCYRTKGDNNDVADQDEGAYDSYIRSSDIGSVFYSEGYHGKIIKGLGNVLTFLQTKFGFFICVLLPMIIFFMYALVRVVFNAAYYRKAKDEENGGSTEGATVNADSGNNNEGVTASVNGLSNEEMEQFRQFQEFQKMQKAQQEAQNQPAEEPKAETDNTPEE